MRAVTSVTIILECLDNRRGYENAVSSSFIRLANNTPIQLRALVIIVQYEILVIHSVSETKEKFPFITSFTEISLESGAPSPEIGDDCRAMIETKKCNN